MALIRCEPGGRTVSPKRTTKSGLPKNILCFGMLKGASTFFFDPGLHFCKAITAFNSFSIENEMPIYGH